MCSLDRPFLNHRRRHHHLLRITLQLVRPVDTVSELRARHGLLKRLHDVGDKVGLVLDTAGDADKVVEDADGLALLAGDAAVGHGAGDFDEGLDTAQGLGEGEDVGFLAEALGSGVPTVDAEGEHAAAHAVAVLLERDGALRVGVQAGVVDEEDVGGGLERGGDARGVLGGLAGAQVQRLKPAVREPAVEGRGDGADGVLQEGQLLEELGRVEGGGAHNDVRVPVDVLRDAVDDNVGAVVQRVLHVGGHEGVIDDDHDAVLVGEGRNLADVDELQGGVRGRLDPDELRVGLDQLLHVELDGRRKRDLDIVRQGDLCEVAVGAAVDIGDGDDVRAGGERLQDVGCGGRAGAVGERIVGVLERCDCAFKVVAGGGVSAALATFWWSISPREAYRLGFDEREYSYSPTGFPTAVCA